MPFLGNIANIVAKKSWTDLGKVLRDMQADIDSLRTARSLENSFIGRGGITIGEDGSLRVQDSDGHTVAIIGALNPVYNRSDGSRQPGFELYREDGSIAAFLGDFNATTPPYKQSFQILDRTGRIVVADDTNSGNGLAKPWLSGGVVWADTNTATWPATTNAAFTAIATCNYQVSNPRIKWDVWIQADAATTGVYRMIVNGTQVGDTATVTGNFDLFSGRQVALPAGVNVDDIVPVTIEAQCSSGTGTVRAAPLFFSGDQSP